MSLAEDTPAIVLSVNEDSEPEPPAIHVHVQLPTQTTDQGVLVWTWVRMLSVPIESLLRIAPIHPWRWVRFACGVTMGTARGALYSSANVIDGDRPLDLDRPFPPDTEVVYFHISEQDREALVPAEPELCKSSGESGSTAESEQAQALRQTLKELVVARDGGCCVVTGARSPKMTEAAHLLPRAKIDVYIHNVTRLHVAHGYPGAQLVTDINDVRNAILIAAEVHNCLGKSVAIMKMPNFAFPEKPEAWEFHVFDEVDAEDLRQRAPHGKGVTVPADRKNWPPSPLFDQVYASAVFNSFSSKDKTLKEHLKKMCSQYHGPGGPMPLTQCQKVNLDELEHQRREASTIQAQERQMRYGSRSSQAPGGGAAAGDQNDADADEDEDEEIPEFAIWQRFLPPDTQRRVYAALLHNAQTKACAASSQRVLEWQRQVE